MRSVTFFSLLCSDNPEDKMTLKQSTGILAVRGVTISASTRVVKLHVALNYKLLLVEW